MENTEVIPDGFSLWSGTWSSSSVAGVKGSAHIPLKNPPKNPDGSEPTELEFPPESFKTKAILSYNGVYMRGTRCILPLVVHSGDNDGDMKNKLEIEGQILNQKISYHVKKITKNSISGSYRSWNPDDSGTFQIKPDDSWLLDYTEVDSGAKCVIS